MPQTIPRSFQTRPTGAPQSRQTRENRFQSWLLRPDQVTAGDATRETATTAASSAAPIAASDAEAGVAVPGPSSQSNEAEAEPSAAVKKTPPTPDSMGPLPKTLLKRVAEVLLYSPLNEWAMRHALNLVKTLSRMNAHNRKHLFEFLMEGVVALATLLTGSLERLSDDLVQDNEKRAQQKAQDKGNEGEAMDTSSPSSASAGGREVSSLSASDSRLASTAATRVMNRFQNGETVVIVGERQPQSLTSDLQLVSLVPFTTKGSAQHRFVKVKNPSIFHVAFNEMSV